MGLPTLINRPRPGLLEHPALWDAEATELGVADATGDRRPVDQLASFSPAIVNVRWATTAVSLVLAGSRILQPHWITIIAMVAAKDDASI